MMLGFIYYFCCHKVKHPRAIKERQVYTTVVEERRARRPIANKIEYQTNVTMSPGQLSATWARTSPNTQNETGKKRPLHTVVDEHRHTAVVATKTMDL